MPSEEFQNLLSQASKLSPSERARLQEVLRVAAIEAPPQQPMSEDQFLDYMERVGKMTRARAPHRWRDVPPTQIPGPPLSLDIIEGRGPR